jgi:hypothetical protein
MKGKKMTEDLKHSAPLMVKVLAVILMLMGLFAGAGSLFLWGQGFLFAFPKDIPLAGPVADFFINFPASFLAGFWLWRMRRKGLWAAQFVAGFYLYASVMIFVEMAQGRLPAEAVIWLPQAFAVAVALVLIFYLWRVRDQFADGG